MPIQTYDYAIVGAGAAGLHLAIKFAKDPYFKEKKILILDKDAKEVDDRTWSFWEVGKTEWDAIASKVWRHAAFYSANAKIDLPLKDYHYKTVRSSNYYAYAKKIIHESSRFDWIKDDIQTIDGKEIVGAEQNYHANHIFDSRIPPEFFENESSYASLTQHFRGWFIETKEPVFDDSKIVMMDYRLKWKDQTTFTYVLPFSPTSALVEFTLFNNELLTIDQYEEKIKEYIATYLQIKEYKIREIEHGAIPMTNYPFTKHHKDNLTKIGTAGGWVRPSSGYSFKNGDRYARMVVDNIKAGRVPHAGVAKNRYRFYDSIFLRVLKDRNDLGEEIFTRLYGSQPIDAMFRFLDEESSLAEDLKIMFSLNKKAFRRALFKTIR